MGIAIVQLCYGGLAATFGLWFLVTPEHATRNRRRLAHDATPSRRALLTTRIAGVLVLSLSVYLLTLGVL